MTTTTVRASAPGNPAPENALRETAPTVPPPRRLPTDDEILGLANAAPADDARHDNAHQSRVIPRRPPQRQTRNLSSSDDFARNDAEEGSHSRPGNSLARDDDAQDPSSVGARSFSSTGAAPDDASAEATSRELPRQAQAALDANPDLRRAWDDAEAYRETFATPDAAREATTRLADLDRLDALFFSPRAEDHAELARVVASLDPAAFASLARAMQSLATNEERSLSRPGNGLARDDNARGLRSSETVRPASSNSPRAQDQGGVIPSEAPAALQGPHPPAPTRDLSSAERIAAQPTPAQSEFFHATNAAAVEGVLGAIESQVDRLLPEGISKSARNRVIGEIYRELDSALQSNRQLAQQIREAFRSGALDTAHQRAAERRVDIAGTGGGNDSVRSITPRDLDYARLSDSDILNL